MTTASPFQQQLAHQPDHAVRQGMAAYPPQAVVPPQPVAPASGDPAVWWAYRGGQPSMPAMAPLPGVPLTSVPSSGSSSAGVGRGSGIGGSADNDPLAMSHESINTLRGGDLVHASSSTVIVTPPDSSISHGTSPLGSTSPVESSASSDLSLQQQRHAAAVAYATAAAPPSAAPAAATAAQQPQPTAEQPHVRSSSPTFASLYSTRATRTHRSLRQIEGSHGLSPQQRAAGGDGRAPWTRDRLNRGCCRTRTTKASIR